MKARIIVLAGAVFIAVSSSRIFAQATASPAPDTTAGKSATLGPVVVSATRSTTSVKSMPLHATVVSQAEVKKAPAQTIDQMLREIPSMNLPGAPYYTTDPTGQQTRMRGVTNSKVLMLVDGVPVHDPFYATTQWFKMPMSSVERIEVVRGGNSSLWGNLAVAGVVNVISKKPVDNSAQMDVNYQSMNTANLALAKNFISSNGLSLRVSGDLLRTDGYQTTPKAFLASVPGKSESSAKNGNGQVSLYYSPGGSYSAFVKGGYHQQNEIIGGYKYGSNLQKSTDGAAGLTRFIGEKSRAEFRAWGQKESFDKSNGAACYLASASSCNTTSVKSPLVQYANSHDDNPYDELGASAIFSTTDVTSFIGALQGGVDFRQLSGEDRATTYNRPTTTDGKAATVNRTNHGEGEQRFVGVFTQLRVTPVQRLEATLSARYDRWANINGISEMVKYTNNVAGATLGGPIRDSHLNSFNPTVSARLEVSDHFSVRGAGYKSFRAPGLNNLYRSFSSTTSITIANPDLKPETLTGGEFGGDLNFNSVSLGATVFQYNTKALIASYRVPNAASAPAAVLAICGATLSSCPATVNFNTNSQDSRARGLELVASWNPSARVGFNTSYTNTDSRYTHSTTGDPINAQLGAIPRAVHTLGMTSAITSKWNAYTSLRHTGGMFLDVNHTIHQKAFTLFNVSTSYRLANNYELYASGTNLSNVKYSDNGTTSAASQTLGMPRSVTGGMRLKF
jgi:iron complex outermembrane receptor protein